MTQNIPKSEAEWQQKLTPAEYAVLREKGTEDPYTGEYVTTNTIGTYHCRACDAKLFSSASKFDAHCGWPAFFTPLAGDSVIQQPDYSGGMIRSEVLCAQCGSHLGHIFSGEGYPTPTNQRYCINSICLRLASDTSANGDLQ